MNLAIKIDNISKVYKLYDKPIDRLKESLSLKDKSYHKNYYALDNVSFEVKKGETIGIIGTNGSGKSTLLKIITGVLNATEGSVTVNGRISALLELGAGFNPEYTGIENVYLNGTMMGYTRDEIRGKINDIVDFADIGEFVNQPVKTYSSGMFVRLAFAVAINIEPEILIVDEALSVGDVFFQSKCYAKFEEFKRAGKTILLVTHDLGSVVKYCDRAILINQGKFIADNKPKEIVDLYKKFLAGQADLKVSEKLKNKSQNDKYETTHWKSQLPKSPNESSYGNKMAEIVDYAIIDCENNITNTILKGEIFQIKLKIKFNEIIKDPIFAFTIRNVKGNEITGTNTMIENIDTNIHENCTKEVTFEQSMDLQGGEYFLCLGCTGFINSELVVYHRLYDVCNISVISSKNSVGFYDMNSRITIL